MAVEKDDGDGVVGVNGFEWRFAKEEEVGGFAGFDGAELRIEFKLARVVDGGGLEDLCEREASVVKLMHFEVAVEARKITVGGT